MKIRITLALFVVAAALGGTARASLTWESTEADLHPAMNDKTVVAHFKYKNSGDKEVRITSVKSSCGCTTAALAKEVVAPNESGEIVATFNIGDRAGKQTKKITVLTDADEGKPTILSLTATIPQLLEITPTFVFWSEKDVLKPKTIEVKVGEGYTVDNLEVTSTDKSLATKVAHPSDKRFTITVTPQESGRPINAALKIEPDFPKDAPKTFYANLRVDSRATMPPK